MYIHFILLVSNASYIFDTREQTTLMGLILFQLTGVLINSLLFFPMQYNKKYDTCHSSPYSHRQASGSQNKFLCNWYIRYTKNIKYNAGYCLEYHY